MIPRNPKSKYFFYFMLDHLLIFSMIQCLRIWDAPSYEYPLRISIWMVNKNGWTCANGSPDDLEKKQGITLFLPHVSQRLWPGKTRFSPSSLEDWHSLLGNLCCGYLMQAQSQVTLFFCVRPCMLLNIGSKLKSHLSPHKTFLAYVPRHYIHPS